MQRVKKAKLVLEDKSVFEGFSFGAEKSTAGEVVFNTGMVGYPESMTDPSYKGQILCFTYPLIGNYGVPSWEKDAFGIPNHFESDRIQVQAIIVSDYSKDYSHWNAEKSLRQWLNEESIPALYGIDTRALTKRLREKGAMLGKIVFNDEKADFYDPNKEDLVSQVSIKVPVVYDPNVRKSFSLRDYNEKNPIFKKTMERNSIIKTFKNKDSIFKNSIKSSLILKKIKNRKTKKIVLVDCGLKNNIIRSFLKRNAVVIRVPYDYDFNQLDYGGLMVSNGPGDPKMCKKTIENIRKALGMNKPIFGICLGNQLLSLAAGADTYKLKYGHRSQNQPCMMKGTKRCFITSQNHGFAVSTKTLPKDWEELFVNVNDSTNEGIRHKRKPFFSCQFHPEATPGPVDTGFLFDEFLGKIK
ncbi:glutamine-hydrolyzing carbamoyl-phosphate synthase small subunit [Candidatus Woesearchaeota archaeon]|nr:glutamine-hydrolyzing carbamoyl-phosphate synthase small subunit [Candidatus Woesearchaeota archaeon]